MSGAELSDAELSDAELSGALSRTSLTDNLNLNCTAF